MPLFQKPVVNKYLKTLDNVKLIQAFEVYKKFFGDKLRLFNILELKEENYQEGFLREVFVNVLGYTINPDVGYNLTTEFKNQTDNKKADGAILKDGQAIGVIELKAAKTLFLDKITDQAFNYKHNQPGCKYVITSNFRHLRLFIDNSAEFEEFGLFEMTFDEFRRFYLFLSKESFFNEIPLKLKEESRIHEEDISDKFYCDYKLFKDKLFENFVKNNPQYDKLILYKKSQKLLDRLLFVWFAEDTGLVPPNAVLRIIDQWKVLRNLEKEDSLYSRFQLFFNHLNTGHVYYNNQVDPPAKTYELPGYDGGLFRPDDILDNEQFIVDDEVLLTDCQKLSSYDYNTDIDVNILGHIFEHSLNVMEEIAAEISGDALHKNKTKRKKEGIFYTPRYITQYIVENTIGELCRQKKNELQIEDIKISEEFRKNNKITPDGRKLYSRLETYKNWLFGLKILDPACGSGAFLNQALEFLIREHRQIDDVVSELTEDKIRMFDTDKSILEQNIFGVDINEESVEIAKLSLWLRTARKDRKLSDLSNNIKCGNSLIDNPEIAGDKAFDWKKEFPQVFNIRTAEQTKTTKSECESDYIKLIKEHSEKAKELAKSVMQHTEKVQEYVEKISWVSEPQIQYNSENFGFDVIIGNPPYVDIKTLAPLLVKEFFRTYETAENRINLYSLFIEKSYKLLKTNGIVSFINPNSILTGSSYTKIRDLLINDLSKIIKLPDCVFPDAKVETIIFQVQKNCKNDFIDTITYKRNDKIDFIDNKLIVKLPKSSWKADKNRNYSIYSTDISSSIISKCEIGSKQLVELADFSLGITPYDKYKGHSKDIIENRRFHSPFKIDDTYKPLITGENIIRYHLRSDINEYIKYGEWLGAKREERFFTQPRIIIRQIVSGKPPRIYACYADKPFYFTQTGFGIISKSKEVDIRYLLSIINSKLINYYHKHKFLDQEKNLFQKILIANCKQFPIKIADNQQYIISMADEILKINGLLENLIPKFVKRLTSNFLNVKITTVLNNYYHFEFREIIHELKKQKIEITLKEQDSWEDYFNDNKQQVNELIYKFNVIDRQIDSAIYQLYGLGADEIERIENETN